MKTGKFRADKWLVLDHTQPSVSAEPDHKFLDSWSLQFPSECSQYPPSKSHLAHMSLPGHTVEIWEVLLFQIFDERAEAGGSCTAFCLISSSITLMDLPVFANTEELACLWIFHCIAMLPINTWISMVLLPLEKDASEDICILSAALLFVSWEADWGPELAGRQAAFSLRFLLCLFVMCTSITAQLSLLFKKQPGLSWSVSCRQTVGVQCAVRGRLPSALIYYHLLELLPSPPHLPCFLSLN